MSVEDSKSATSPMRHLAAAKATSRVKLVRVWLCRALLLVTIGCVNLAGQAEDSPEPRPLGTILDVGGYRVHVYCAGSGNPPVMIVGAAFSFDWDLVQSAVAKFTRVCSFDPSGTAWSDPFEVAVRSFAPEGRRRTQPTCEDRVEEIHRVVANASVEAPYILVGYSVGALWERLYAGRYPAGVGGMVMVDHAFLPETNALERKPETQSAPGADRGPVLLAQAPIAFGFEDDAEFARLPQRDRALHQWAMARHPIRPDEAMAKDCFSEVEGLSSLQPYPLDNVPLTVIRTENEAPGYADLQRKLLELSHQSRQIVAWNSSHMVLIDQPEVIVSAIQAMVESARRGKIEKQR